MRKQLRRRDTTAGKCQQPAAGGSDRIGIRLWNYPFGGCEPGGDLLDRVVMIRRQIALELGTVVPIIRLRDNIQLNPNQYIIKIKGIQVSEGEILFDHYMAMNPGM